MFVFFFTEEEITPGNVCEVISGTMAGKKVIVSKLHGATFCWAHDAVPARYRVNGHGRRVLEFDPACSMSPYSTADLRVLKGEEREAVIAPLRGTYKDSWSRKYVE